MSEASRLVQSRTAQDIQGQEEESAGRGNSGSDNAKSIIFGGTDGLFHSLSLVAATAGANLSRNVVVVVGFATVAAGGAPPPNPLESLSVLPSDKSCRADSESQNGSFVAQV